MSAHKKRARPPNKEEESKPASTGNPFKYSLFKVKLCPYYDTYLVVDHSPEGAGLTVEEGGLKDGVWPVGLERQPVSEQGAEPELQLTFDIKAAFKSFRGQLEQHLKV